MAARRKAASSDGWTWDLTQRECVRRGWHVERVDWRDGYGHSHDLLSVFDALAWEDTADLAEFLHDFETTPGVMARQTYAIQFTDSTHRAARRRKVQALPILPLLRAAGWVPLVWAWRIKDGKPVLAEDRV